MKNLNPLRSLFQTTDLLVKNEKRIVALAVVLGAVLLVVSWIPDLLKFLHDGLDTVGSQGAQRNDWGLWLREHGQEAARDAAKFLFSASALMAVLLAYLRQGGAQFDYLRVLLSFRKHAILCGMSTRSMLLAEDLVNKGKNVVIIDLDEKYKESSAIRMKGISVLRGDARRDDVLGKAGLRHALHLVCMTESDETNLAILEAVRGNLGVEQRRSGIAREFVCFCHIRRPNLRSHLERLAFMGPRTEGPRFRLFNIEETTAAELLRRYPPEAGIPLDQQSLHVHVALFGGGDFALALAIQMAQLCHYWRLDYLSESFPRTRLTIVSRDAEALLRRLRQMCPAIDQLLSLQAISLRPEDPSASAALLGGEPASVSQVFVALEEQVSCLAVASQVAAQLRRAPRSYAGRIVAIMPACRNRIDPRTWIRNDAVEIFESYESCKDEVVIGGVRDKMAETAHSEYLTNAMNTGAAVGDRPSLYDWSNLGEFLRASNRQQIAHMSVKLRVLGLEIDNTSEAASWDGNLKISPEQLEQLAEMEHRRWVGFYLVHGWIGASERNDDAREHDCLVPYCQLSGEMKEYDRHVVRSMEKLCRTAGYVLRQTPVK